MAYFPNIYPDEDYRSLVYRYHVLSGNGDYAATNRELFGRGTYKTTVLPRNLKFLIDQFPKNTLTTEWLLLNHTFFYNIRPFIPKEKLSRVYDEILNNIGDSNISSLLGKRETRLISKYYRYCPTCIKNDYQTYGEAYLHRTHQLAFLTHCPEHSDDLLSHCPNCREPLGEPNVQRMIISRVCVCGQDLSNCHVEFKSASSYIKEKVILENFQQIKKHATSFSLDEILIKLKSIAGQKGYISYTGRIVRKRFIEDFQKYLDENHFRELLPLNTRAQLRSTSFILSNSGVKNIVFYVLIIMFLCESVEEFIKDTSSFSIPIPFGNGPWNCMNPVCEGLDQPVIRRCIRVDRDGKYISGLFSCPLCGFSFAKRWRLEEHGQEKLHSVLTMGSLWQSSLVDLKNHGLNNNQIAKKLKTTATQIRRALARLNNPSSDTRIKQSLDMISSDQNSCNEVATTSEFDRINAIEQDRKRMKKILRENRGVTRTELSKKYNHFYHKMLKNDREWMEQVLPPSQKNRIRTNWPELDKKYSAIISKISDRLYELNPPEQIKKYTILAHLPPTMKSHIENSPHRLPQSLKLLMERVESDDDYLVRHLPVIIAQMRKYSKSDIILDRIKSFSPMYRKSTKTLDKKILEKLNV